VDVPLKQSKVLRRRLEAIDYCFGRPRERIEREHAHIRADIEHGPARSEVDARHVIYTIEKDLVENESCISSSCDRLAVPQAESEQIVTLRWLILAPDISWPVAIVSSQLDQSTQHQAISTGQGTDREYGKK
jgi:hypothetical protein